jgi:hypothetical protein
VRPMRAPADGTGAEASSTLTRSIGARISGHKDELLSIVIAQLRGAVLDNEENSPVRKLFTGGVGMVAVSN